MLLFCIAVLLSIVIFNAVFRLSLSLTMIWYIFKFEGTHKIAIKYILQSIISGLIVIISMRVLFSIS